MLTKVRSLILFFCLGLVFWIAQSAQATVEILSFRAYPAVDGIMLEWETASETNNSGFYILRSTRADGIYQNIIFVLSESLSGEGQLYQYVDDTVNSGIVYYYKLESIDLNGQWEFFGPVSGVFGTSPWTVTPTGLSTASRTSTSTSTLTGVANATRTATPTASLVPTDNTGIYPYPVSTSTSQVLPVVTVTPSPSPSINSTLPAETGTVTTSAIQPATQDYFGKITPFKTLDLLFPAATQTVTPQQTNTPVVGNTPFPIVEIPLKGNLNLGRTYALLSIPILLWVSLAVFLVVLVRKLSG